VDGITLLGMRRYGLNRSSRAIKRAVDLVGASLGVLVLAPLLTAIAVAIKLDSAGPASSRSDAWAATTCHSRCSSSARW
jgi:lipopolysaccharide/colanic/teichoic acid biosynthesis glycosyltransferase